MADNKEDGEKLFSSERTPDPQTAEVAKFIPENEHKNGVSPISVEAVKSKFTGLTKEELMKYAKDPFWVRIRWCLFILFWLIWFLMLFGAVFVIIVTPKCKESPPPLWWQRSSIYRADVSKLIGNDSAINALQNRINYLSNLGVETLLLESVLEANENSSQEVWNFTNVNSALNSSEVFKKKIIDYANEKGVHIIIAFTPNFSGLSSKMFSRSEIKEDEDLKDRYVWYPQEFQTRPDNPPNNWLTVYNTSAWEWNDKRKQFYLHQFNSSEPEFNFRNPNTVKEFNDVFKFWLKLGIKGFHLDKAEYLIEDSTFKDETVGHNTSFAVKEYGYYLHHRTFELPETTNLLANWSTIIRNESAVISVSGGVKERKEIADFVLRPLYLSPNFTAKELNDRILLWKNAVNQPTWEWKCKDASMKDCIPENAIDGLAIISFLLPGTPVLELGQEFGNETVFGPKGKLDERLWDKVYGSQLNDSESHFNVIKKLIKMREIPSVTYGTFNSTVLNETVFAFTRIKPGNPGYLVAWNLGRQKTTLNFREFAAVPEDVMMALKSGHIFKDLYPLKSRIYSSSIELPPMAAAVFSFVPLLK